MFGISRDRELGVGYGGTFAACEAERKCYPAERELRGARRDTARTEGRDRQTYPATRELREWKIEYVSATAIRSQSLSRDAGVVGREYWIARDEQPREKRGGSRDPVS